MGVGQFCALQAFNMQFLHALVALTVFTAVDAACQPGYYYYCCVPGPPARVCTPGNCRYVLGI